jgi:type II secretory pathway predicted ATPase ExeA
MYQSFFGLRELPFELTPNPKYVFLSARHREALCNLHYGITARRGITLLVGEAGTGKTTLVHTALGLVGQNDVRCVYLNNPTLTRTEFVEFLAQGFGLRDEARHSKAVFLTDLQRVLTERLAADLPSGLLIDEAQSLSHELLEEIRLLANMETSTAKLLPVVLAGQPELADRLNEPSLRQLKQRVALRCALLPLQLQETAAYIAARLDRAGGRGADIFFREAVETIHERSKGIPRTISVICDNALIAAFANDRKPIDRATVLEVCRGLDLGGPYATIAPAARPGGAPPHASPRSIADPANSGAVPSSTGPRVKPEPTTVASGPALTGSGRRRRFSFFGDAPEPE